MDGHGSTTDRHLPRDVTHTGGAADERGVPTPPSSTDSGSGDPPLTLAHLAESHPGWRIWEAGGTCYASGPHLIGPPLHARALELLAQQLDAHTAP